MPKLNREHPIVRGLYLDIPFFENSGTTPRDTVRGLKGAFQNSPTWVRTPYGPAIQTVAASSQWVKYTTTDTVSGEFSAEVIFRPDGMPTTQSLLSSRIDGENSFDMKISSGTLVHGDIGNAAGSWITTAADATFLFSPGQWYQVVYTVTQTGYTIYVNGQNIGSGSYGAASPVLLDSTHHIGIGTDSTNGGNNFSQATFLLARVWKRAITSREVSQLYANPWQIYSGPKTTLASISAGSNLSANVSDLITVSESVNLLETSFVSVSDTATVTESINQTLVHNAAVSDSITVSESVATTLVHNAPVSDAITVSESIGRLLTSFISISDSVILSEVLTPLLIAIVAVAESVTVSESINQTLVHNAAVSDSITVSETPSLLETSFVGLAETVTVSESITVSLQSTLTISVSESITLSESTQLLETSFVSLADTVTSSESVAMTLVYNTAVSDAVTTNEALILLETSFVSAVETITTTDSVQVSPLTLAVLVSDTITISESVQALQTSFVSASDTLTISESTQLLATSFVTVTETITTSEAVTATEVSFVNVSDTITTTEVLSVNEGAPGGALQIHVTDIIGGDPQLILVDGRLALRIAKGQYTLL